LGFRIRGAKGQSYGPYLQPDKFKVKNLDPKSAAAGTMRDDSCVIADIWDHPIYYCPSNGNADPTQSKGFVAKYAGPTSVRPMYDTNYLFEPNSTFSTAEYQERNQGLGPGDVVSTQSMGLLLGERHPANGMIEAGENPVRLPFLLWSAGPNGMFGLDLNLRTAISADDLSARHLATDDITNFIE